MCKIRFSLRSLLGLCTTIAMVAAIAQKYPALGALLAGLALLALPVLSKIELDNLFLRFFIMSIYLPIVTILIVCSFCIVVDDLRLFDVSF